MLTRVIINGARGKMGILACETISKHPDFKLVGSLSREDNLRLAIEREKAQIVVDLTRADCVFDNSLAIIESGAHPVIGTSGLLTEQITHLQELCRRKQLGGIIVPNFSISAVLMMHFAALAAHHLTAVEIIEAHHPQKFDAPSGTALKTAEMIAAARAVGSLLTGESTKSSNELIGGARGGLYQDIAIHSLRLPGILANQQVIFGSMGETLTITHNTLDRSAFMPGIILCCQKVQQLQSLYYGLEQVIDIN